MEGRGDQSQEQAMEGLVWTMMNLPVAETPKDAHGWGMWNPEVFCVSVKYAFPLTACGKWLIALVLARFAER